MPETIQVFYRNIGQVGISGIAPPDAGGSNEGSGRDYYHKYIVYTNSAGEQFAASGWPGTPDGTNGPSGNITITIGKYNSNYRDHPVDLRYAVIDEAKRHSSCYS